MSSTTSTHGYARKDPRRDPWTDARQDVAVDVRVEGLSETLCKRVVLSFRAMSGGSGRITQHEYTEV